MSRGFYGNSEVIDHRADIDDGTDDSGDQYDEWSFLWVIFIARTKFFAVI